MYGGTSRSPPPRNGKRSIPACTGEPAHAGPQSLAKTGLSPRVRGNRGFGEAQGYQWRSIPACTGEPAGCIGYSRGGVYPRVYGGTTTALVTPAPARVYPRVYGGTSLAPFSSLTVRGLSPRVRGNRDTPAPKVIVSGSIPACTGEPYTKASGAWTQEVYPRVYGGTELEIHEASSSPGLSPRVRGNLH